MIFPVPTFEKKVALRLFSRRTALIACVFSILSITTAYSFGVSADSVRSLFASAFTGGAVQPGTVREIAPGSSLHESAEPRFLAASLDATLGSGRSGHTATLLSDGKVLITGGNSDGSSEVYDPAADVSASTGYLNAARSGHTASRLSDGRVLITGGTVGGSATASTEVYDPSNGTFSTGPSMGTERSGHTATVLSNGSVLIAGGGSDTAEIFDGGSFTAVAAAMVTSHTNASSVLMADGRVFIAGGNGSKTAEIFNPADGTFTAAGNGMTLARARAHLRVLPDGKIQIIGGNNDGSMEIYDPAIDTIGAYAHVVPGTDTCASLPAGVKASQTRAALFYNGSPDPAFDRSGHTITEVAGNRAVVIGGTDNAGNPLNAATVFTSSPASITTDQLDYAPGETVTFSGTGFQAGETVRVVIHEDPHTHTERNFSAVADAEGKFTGSYQVESHDIGVNFIVAAKGQVSGWNAHTAFSDGNVDVKSINNVHFDYQVTLYSSSNCTTGSGTADTKTATTNGSTTGVGNTQSLLITANLNANAPNAAASFSHWTMPPNNQNASIQLAAGYSATDRTICVVGFQQASRDLIGHYTLNSGPTINRNNATVTVNEGQTATNTGTWSDANAGDTVTLSASVGTVTKSGTNASGTWSWSYGTTDGPAQSQTVTITANDGNGGITTTTFSLTVTNVAPTATFNASSPVNEGSPISLSLTAPSDPSTDDTTAGFTYAFDCGDGSGYGAFGSSNSTSCPTTDNGTRTVKGKIQDKDGGVTEYTASVTVDNVAPVINDGDLSVTPATINENGSVTLNGVFTDPGTADTHTVTINWGDGSAATTLNLAAGVLTFSTSHQYLDDNPTATPSDENSITVTVTDDDSGTDGANASVTVNNVAPEVGTPVLNPEPSDEGSSVSVSASITDTGTLDAFTCSIDWGDGSPAAAGTISSGACTGSHTYADNGSYTVSVTVNDDDTGTDSNSASHVVNNVAPTVGTVSISPEPSNEGSSVNLSAGFTDPGTLDTHTCSINWGDSSPASAGTIASGACTGSHTYGDNGSYTVTVTVTDDDGGIDAETQTHVVNNVAPSVGAVTVTPEPSLEGGSVTASATFTDPGTNDAPFTCTVNYGDGSGVQPGTVDGNTCNGPAHTYSDNGNFTVTVAVTDKDAGTGSNSAIHAVNNADPTVGAVTAAPEPSNEGDLVSASAGFTDPGTNDGPFTCTVDYGDGSGPQVGTVNAGTCTGTPHAYADNGTFTITIAVTDKDNGTGTNTVGHVVNNANPVVGAVATNTPTNEGSAATASASFTDAGTADTHTCSIDWGDGNTTAGTVTQGAGSGSCGGSHIYADEGTGSYTVTVTVTDDDSGSGSNSATHTVTNVAPTITNLAVAPEPSTEGNLDTVTATFTDPGTLDVFSCSINWGDGNTTAGTVSAGACTGTHAYADNSSYTVSVTIDDGDGGSDTESANHVVSNVNPSVTVVTLTPEPSFEGSVANLSATFTDPGTADTHSCTIDWGDGNTTSGAAASGACTGSHTYANEGSFTVNVVVTDDDGGSGSGSTAHLVLNVAPTVGAVTVTPEPSDEGGSATASASFNDPGVNDTFTCTVNYGDGSGPQAGTIAGNICNGPAHTYADDGTYTVTVAVSDNGGGTGNNSANHQVNNLPPTVNDPTVSPEPSDEGGSVTASATFTDPGTGDGPFTCTVDYGDGSGAQNGSVVGSTCTGPAHTYADNGNYPVTVAVTDKDGGTGSNSATHVVNNVDPVVGSVTTNSPTNEGSTATASANFTDAGTVDTHTCTIDWGDGNSTTGTVTQGSGTGSCSGSHAYADNGSYTVTISVTDNDGGTDSNTAAHAVSNVAPTVTALTVLPEPSNEGGSVNLSASFTDPGTQDTHTCTINWGDGSGTQTVIAGSGTCTASHVYGDNGTYSVTVTVTDDDEGADTETTSHVVNNVPPTVGAVTVSPEPSVEGSAATASAPFTDPGANDGPFTCTVNYGDGSGPLAGSVTGNTCNGPSHVYADNGSYTVTVSVTDKNGGTGSNSGTHGVTNANPVITAIAGPTDPIQIGGSTSITASFTDAGTADTHTCSINWGNGTTTNGFVTEVSGSGTCSGSYTYPAVGVYQITVTVTDDDGGSDTEVYQQFVVIFDPKGGFVTGGGWINSPAGAYPADPTAVGKANFGFVSKYKNGASVPEGETEFQFKAGNLNFHSIAYEWMVISGAKARYRGTGTINGSGNYAFELTAWDGQVTGGGGIDRFRIRIYGVGGNDVYDNMLGVADGVDPTTTLGGGSIVIHKTK